MRRFPKFIHAPCHVFIVWVGCCFALTGCGGGAAQAELTPVERATARDDSPASPHLLVALRVTAEAESDRPRVRLVAVTYDMDGQATMTDLGSYEGTAVRGEPEGAELIRIAIEDGNQQRVVRLVRREGFIEAHHTPEGGAASDDELILRIPVRQGVRLMLSDPAIEIPR